MTSVIRIISPEHLAAQDTSLLPSFDPRTLVRQAPDAHWLALNRAGQAVGRLSLWWNQAPPHPGHRLGLIGHFAAAEADAALPLMARAVTELAERGCTLAVGPMDGNTWRRYRLVTQRGTEPAFFLEPDNPDEWPQWFGAAGFEPLATYFSALNDDLSREDPRLPRVRERMERAGIQLRALQPECFVEELRRIYALCLASFQGNFLYTPILEAEFLEQYEAVRPHLRPELVWLAEADGQAVGFVFALPDLLQAARGRPVDTVVIKTLAVLPGRGSAGLGNLLLSRCQQAARTLGYRRAIHALMHESNASLNLSSHYAKPFRRYTLFARQLKERP